MVSIGRKLRQAREQIGMSQTELARLSNKDQAAISAYEMDKRRISANDLPEFAALLEVPIMFFFLDAAPEDALDHIMLTEFRDLPTTAAKEAAVESLRIFKNALKEHTQ